MTNVDLKTAIRDDLSIATGDSFFSDAYIQRIANRAVKWLAGLHNWQQTQESRKRDSEANQEYYNYPENYKTDSIFKLSFNGDRYDRKSFEEYEKYKEDFTSGATDKIYTDFKRQMFLNPAPTTVAEITIWGHVIPDDMSADADTHPFAKEGELEELIIQYAEGLAKQKGRGTLYNAGVADCQAAESKANKLWEAQKKEQAKYQTKDAEQFDFFEILPRNGNQRRTQRGNFETCTC